MAPDPRFALRSPKLGEPVVLFRLPEGIAALEEVSEKYKNTLLAIALGSFVAHADGAPRRNAARLKPGSTLRSYPGLNAPAFLQISNGYWPSRLIWPCSGDA